MPESNLIIIHKIILKLLDVNTPKLLTLIRNLNAKYEYAHLAQYLMHEILPKFDLEGIKEQISKDPTFKVGALFESLRLYNEKHYTRMDKQLTNSYFVDYLVS